MVKENIAFIPIDNRPVCYSLPKQIAKIDSDLNLFLPERCFLGDLTKNADIDAILNWLENINVVEKIIISLDTIAYGGLIPSRRSNENFLEIKTRLEKLKNILVKKNIKVYAFSSIMRISNNNFNEEEKEYWNLYGEKIFKYSFESHKNAPKQFVNTDIPEDILQDYLATRKRNFEINQLYLEWLKEGIIDTLVYSKDDCAEFGFNVTEAQFLENKIKEYKLNALVKTGADEIPLSLLSRALTDSQEIKISVEFTCPNSINKISKYEDVTVLESVKGQIELAGGILVDSTEADIVLFVNNFKDEQGELVMGIDVKGFDSELKLPNKPYLIADILNANGADNLFIEKFFNLPINWHNFYGYAGWNTTGNTLGSALCCAITKFFALSYDESAFKNVQCIRLLDDWAYQANVRKLLKLQYTDVNISALVKEMKSFEGFLEEKFSVKLSSVSYDFTWNRFFEIEVFLNE